MKSSTGVDHFRRRPDRLDGGDGLDRLAQIDVDLPLRQNLDHAERRAAQAIGVGGRFRLQPGGEQADQAVEPVGDRQQRPGSARRQRIIRAARQPVFVDGVGDFAAADR